MINESQVKEKCNMKLDDLPVELIQKTCKYIRFNDVKNMRLVNRRYRLLVDTNDDLFKRIKIRLKIDDENIMDILDAIKQMRKILGIRECIVTCPYEINVHELKHFMTNLENKYIKLSMLEINMKNLSIVNVFSHILGELEIRTITRDINSLMKEPIEKQLDIPEGLNLYLEKVKKLRLEFVFKQQTDDLEYKKKVENIIYEVESSNVDNDLKSTLEANLLIHNAKTCSRLLQSLELNTSQLTELYLYKYNGSLRVLLAAINGCSLNIFNFAHSLAKIDLQSQDLFRFSAKNVIFEGIHFNLCNEFLTRGIISLSEIQLLYLNKSFSVYTRSIIDIPLEALSKLFQTINGKLTNCEEFATSLDCHRVFHQIQYKFSSKIKELIFKSKLFVRQFSDFVQSGLIFDTRILTYFEKITFDLHINCESPSDIHLFLTSLRSLAFKYSCLKKIILHFSCNHRFIRSLSTNRNDRCLLRIRRYSMFSSFYNNYTHEFTLNDFVRLYNQNFNFKYFGEEFVKIDDEVQVNDQIKIELCAQ